MRTFKWILAGLGSLVLAVVVIGSIIASTGYELPNQSRSVADGVDTPTFTYTPTDTPTDTPTPTLTPVPEPPTDTPVSTDTPTKTITPTKTPVVIPTAMHACVDVNDIQAKRVDNWNGDLHTRILGLIAGLDALAADHPDAKLNGIFPWPTDRLPKDATIYMWGNIGSPPKSTEGKPVDDTSQGTVFIRDHRFIESGKPGTGWGAFVGYGPLEMPHEAYQAILVCGQVDVNN